jgi:hypothetical protein
VNKEFLIYDCLKLPMETKSTLTVTEILNWSLVVLAVAVMTRFLPQGPEGTGTLDS